MAVYAASKHAVEGYSESMDHEVREHGVRVLLVEPAVTTTGFEAARSMQPEMPLQVYAEQRHHAYTCKASTTPRSSTPSTPAAPR
jgi:short-subunit dehydrogenase